MQSLCQGLTAHFPAGPKLVEAVPRSNPRPRLALLGRFGHLSVLVSGAKVPEVSSIEFESVDPVLADQTVEILA